MKLFYFLRSQDDFERFIKDNNLQNLNFIRNEQFFNVDFQNINQNDIEDYDFIIMSSGMSVKHFISLKIILNQKQKILVIGKYSASRLPSENIEYIGENIDSIVDYMESNISHFINKKLLYLRGNHITFDIKNHFKARAKIDEFLLYNISYYKDFSDEFKHNLKNENISSIAFYSYKSLENFLSVVLENNLDNCLKSINAYVMNKKSIDIGNKYFSDVFIVDSDKILKILKKFCK